MCGIVGYIGKRNPKDIIYEGLKKLEYRGYDSAGIALFQEGKIKIKRSQGKLSQLQKEMADPHFFATPHHEIFLALGHTRWATQGRPSEKNAHPHQAGSVVLVHNGIIENFSSIKETLLKKGHTFASDTDSEVIASLINDHIREGHDFETSVQRAAQQLVGSFSVGVMFEGDPGTLIAVRNGTPLVLGVCESENFIASDIAALLSHTHRFVYLEDQEMAVLKKGQWVVKNLNGKPISKAIKEINWTQEMIEKGGFQHFMLKEIFEQPQAVIHTLQDRVRKDEQGLLFPEVSKLLKELNPLGRIYLVACGSAYYASMVGKYLFEQFSHVPCEQDLASEFRYREPLIGKNDLLIVTSQSGETADTLAALREAKKRGAKVLAICNVKESSIDREADVTVYTYAGPEIGVASTKAFTAQLTVFGLLAIHVGMVKGVLSEQAAFDFIQELIRLPLAMENLLKQDAYIKKIAQKFYRKKTFLYLGRGTNYPIALEGALKLKEISYMNAEGYAAGEMKHGPIALVDEDTPVIILAPQDRHYEKVLSNLEEIKARDGVVIAIGNEGDERLKKLSDYMIEIPKRSELCTPILEAIPVQLIAYDIALKKGTDIDQPRNLAKSVTVE
ncbi:MAG: glutamine--fructose-6-phosphate transaminase (isomerizing) [Deltaproteobacteria bacterium]|nr:glutamine--fructose-6-phosphate transaminase (isomerizing) [Deltaproteobacteria bacterium]